MMSAGTERLRLVTVLVGGGPSLSLTRLCYSIPVSGKNTGNISHKERSFAGSFRDKSHPERLPSNSVKRAPSEEQGINRELRSKTFFTLKDKESMSAFHLFRSPELFHEANTPVGSWRPAGHQTA